MGGKNSEQADPFARLVECHRRIEERLDQLVRAADDLAAGVGPSAALADAEEVAGYLGRGALRHTEDEEQTLFPRLRAHAELAAVLAELEKQHGDHRGLEDQIRALVYGWRGEVPARPEAEKLGRLARSLKEVYAPHIEREEKDLFPRARQLLPADVVELMGREMMERRPDRGRKN